MLKSHKKLHRRMAKARPDGQKAHCCLAVFVGNPDWGGDPAQAPALPARWVRGIRVRPAGPGQR
jgi:hypothetical protein